MAKRDEIRGGPTDVEPPRITCMNHVDEEIGSWSARSPSARAIARMEHDAWEPE